MTQRTTFEGREVIGTQVKVAQTVADTDSSADPHYVGDSVFVVCEAVIDRVEHQAVKDSDKLVRVARARPLVGALVDVNLVREAIELARMAAEAREGVQRLGFEDQQPEP